MQLARDGGVDQTSVFASAFSCTKFLPAEGRLSVYLPAQPGSEGCSPKMKKTQFRSLPPSERYHILCDMRVARATAQCMVEGLESRVLNLGFGFLGLGFGV